MKNLGYGVAEPVTVLTTTATVAPNGLYLINASATFVVSLPLTPPDGSQVSFLRVDANVAPNITIKPTSPDTFLSYSQFTMGVRGAAASFTFYSGVWYVTDFAYDGLSSVQNISLSSGDANSIAVRGAGGRLQVATPTGITDATSKSYVDAFQATRAFATLTNTAALAANTNYLINAAPTSGTVTLTLPTAPTNHTVIELHRIDNQVGTTVNIAPGGTDIIDDATPFVLMWHMGIRLVYDSTTTSWYTFGTILGRNMSGQITPSSVANAYLGIMTRDANGNTQVADPTIPAHAATKNYVDGTVRTVTANTTAVSRDTILANAAGGPITITVPVTAGADVFVKKIDSSVNNVTVVPASGTIDGDATAVLTGAQAAALFVGDGTNVRIEAINGVTGSAAATVPLAASISSLGTPIIIAHRGGVDMAPEHTMRAYRTALAQGADMIEQDLTQLADGSFAVIHDATIDRVTTGTGNVNAFTAHGFAGLNMNMAILPGSAYGDASVEDLRPLLWTDVLREFGNNVLLCPEIKTAGTGAAMLTTLQRAGISPDAVLVQSFNQSDLLPLIAAGYKTIYLGSTDGAAAKTTGHWAIGPAYTAVTSGIVTTAHANGIKVLPYTIDRRFDRDSLLAMGVDGYFVNDPMYIKGDTMLRTTDAFHNGFMIPGMQENGTVVNGPTLQDPPNHSKFYGSSSEPGNASYWGYDVPSATTVTMYALHGYLNPPNPSAYTINFNLKLIGIAGAGTDTTRWAGMFLGNTDVPFLDSYNWSVQANPNVQGYHFLMRASGALDIYYFAGGSTAAVQISTLAGVAGNAFSVNEEQAMRIQVTATNLILTNVTTGASNTIAHSTIRSLRYINMSMSGAAWQFKGVTVS